MSTMRRRETTCNSVYHRHPVSSPNGHLLPQLPTTTQRSRSVATSNPTFHEATRHPSWLLKQKPYSISDSKLSVKYKISSSLLKWLPCLLLMVVPWIPVLQTKLDINAKRIKITSLLEDKKAYAIQLEVMTGHIRELQKDIERLTKENEIDFQELHRNGETTPDLETEQYVEVEKAEEALVARIDTMEQHIQKMSEKLVKKRYGNGPHKVKVTVEETPGKLESFIIELALLVEMPHAVHHFLQMVELKLWDNLTFLHGVTSDVIMATPMMMDGVHEWAGQRFVDANLTQLAFSEYSSSYPPPHKHKYSVAFSGRPGGPDFYISFEDDLKSHEHESTFGIVVEGRDVLDRFFSLRGQANQVPDQDRVDMMTIRSMVLLKSEE